MENDSIYDLNLSERYVPEWGAWEVGREIISNAIDADPDKYVVEKVDANTIRVWTSSCPALNQVRVLGLGTKSRDGETIGQFGEGFKLAALATCRGEGSLSVVTPDFIAEYFLAALEGEDMRVLKMRARAPREPASIKGCDVWIRMPGISAAIEGRFLDHKSLGPIPKKNRDETNFYLRGVWVMRIKKPSLYDWNVDHCGINRDRSVLSDFQMKERIAVWLSRNMDKALAAEIVDAPRDSFEYEALQLWPERVGQDARTKLNQAVIDFYGTNIVLACDDSYANQVASSRGKKVVVLPPGLAGLVHSVDPNDGFIKKADQDIPKDHDLVQSKISAGNDFIDEMDEIRRVIDLLGIPAEVLVFRNNSENEYGRAVYDSGRKLCRVWLNEKLFMPGRRLDRIATLCHELGHMDGGKDETAQFEHSLDKIAGKLALAWLERRTKKPAQKPS